MSRTALNSDNTKPSGLCGVGLCVRARALVAGACHRLRHPEGQAISTCALFVWLGGAAAF